MLSLGENECLFGATTERLVGCRDNHPMMSRGQNANQKEMLHVIYTTKSKREYFAIEVTVTT